MWCFVKQTNTHIMGIIREENRKDIPRKKWLKTAQIYWKKTKQNNDLFIQEPEKAFSRINAETQRDTIVKILKVKDKQYKKND